MQAITFRLADSLPSAIYGRLIAETADEADRRRKLDAMIDEGRGACILRNDAYAIVVRTALEHFDGERYRLIAWVIMPNHVHVLIEQLEGFPLGDIVRGWKSFSAKEINKVRGLRDAVWAPDYHDRYIRDGRHLGDAVAYIENKPINARLVKQARDWPYSSAAVTNAGVDARGPGN